MLKLSIVLDGEGKFPELQGRVVHKAEIQTITGLPGGTVEGRPTVALLIPLEDGSVVFAETTLRLFLQAAAALRGKYGEE